MGCRTCKLVRSCLLSSDADLCRARGQGGCLGCSCSAGNWIEQQKALAAGHRLPAAQGARLGRSVAGFIPPESKHPVTFFLTWCSVAPGFPCTATSYRASRQQAAAEYPELSSIPDEDMLFSFTSQKGLQFPALTLEAKAHGNMDHFWCLGGEEKHELNGSQPASVTSS